MLDFGTYHGQTIRYQPPLSSARSVLLLAEWPRRDAFIPVAVNDK